MTHYHPYVEAGAGVEVQAQTHGGVAATGVSGGATEV